jgi:hypothetical protein
VPQDTKKTGAPIRSPGPSDAGIMCCLAPLRYLWPSKEQVLTDKYYRKVVSTPP